MMPRPCGKSVHLRQSSTVCSGKVTLSPPTTSVPRTGSVSSSTGCLVTSEAFVPQPVGVVATWTLPDSAFETSIPYARAAVGPQKTQPG